jgi:hypothetical protein
MKTKRYWVNDPGDGLIEMTGNIKQNGDFIYEYNERSGTRFKNYHFATKKDAISNAIYKDIMPRIETLNRRKEKLMAINTDE